MKPKVTDLGDTGVRYGGRTAIVTFYLNTAETLESLQERFTKLAESRAARGAKMDMCVVTLGIKKDASELWVGIRDNIAGPNKA